MCYNLRSSYIRIRLIGLPLPSRLLACFGRVVNSQSPFRCDWTNDSSSHVWKLSKFLKHPQQHKHLKMVQGLGAFVSCLSLLNAWS
jgi:hypothetical protein